MEAFREQPDFCFLVTVKIATKNAKTREEKTAHELHEFPRMITDQLVHRLH